MKFTEENTVELYHYLKELLDALRPIRNTPGILNNPDNIDNAYWKEKLFQLDAIISGILEVDPITQSPIVNDSLQADLLNSFLPLLNQYQEKQLRDDVFKIALAEMLRGENFHIDEETYKKVVNSSIKITDEALKQIKQHYEHANEPD